MITYDDDDDRLFLYLMMMMFVDDRWCLKMMLIDDANSDADRWCL